MTVPLYSGFQPGGVVIDPRYLFGRSGDRQLLNMLTRHVRTGTNTQLLGERRAGKTSLLRCFPAKLVVEDRLVPVYLNYREYPTVRGAADAYRLLLAHIHAAVLRYRGAAVIDETNSALGVSPEPMAAFESLKSVADTRVDSALDDYLDDLARQGLGVIVLLDEYEHLMLHTYEGQPGSFFHLRDLASQPPQPGQPKLFTYVIAGRKPWHDMCTLIGSPELNATGVTLSIGPLNAIDFAAMWQHCLGTTSAELRDILPPEAWTADWAYSLSGGWPFYGKVIGQHLLAASDGDEAAYGAILASHFTVVWTGLSQTERQYLTNASCGQLDVPGEVGNRLLRLGLLERDEDQVLIPCGQLWRSFVADQVWAVADEVQSPPTLSDPVAADRLRLLVEDIQDLITSINETSLNYGGEEIFQTSNQDIQTYRDLARPASDKDTFQPVATALYLHTFERTQGEKRSKLISSDGKRIEEGERIKPLMRLPSKFRRHHRLIRMIDSVRHKYGKGHLPNLWSNKTDGMNIAEVLQHYFGSKRDPEAQQFRELQEKLLIDFRQYLVELKDYHADQLTNQAKQPSHKV